MRRNLGPRALVPTIQRIGSYGTTGLEVAVARAHPDSGELMQIGVGSSGTPEPGCQARCPSWITCGGAADWRIMWRQLAVHPAQVENRCDLAHQMIARYCFFEIERIE